MSCMSHDRLAAPDVSLTPTTGRQLRPVGNAAARQMPFPLTDSEGRVILGIPSDAALA